MAATINSPHADPFPLLFVQTIQVTEAVIITDLCRALVADEYAPAAASLSELLKVLKCEVIVAPTVESVAMLVGRYKPDVFFIDLDTECNPFELVKDLLLDPFLQNSLYIATTTEDGPDLRTIPDIFTCCLLKPFEANTIQRIIEAARAQVGITAC